MLAGLFARIYEHNLKIRALYALQAVESRSDQLRLRIEALRVKIATLHYTTLPARAAALNFSDARPRSKTVEVP